jgi:glycosyltransferase involved in cell wall biosynthesis
MRIAYFTESLPPLTDGVSHTLTNLRDSLVREGHEFLFFSPFVPEPDAWDNNVVEILSAPFPLYRKYRFSMPLFHDMKSMLAQFKPDIVHVCSPFFLGMAAYSYAREAGIPAVNSYHTRFASYMKYYKFGWLEWFAWGYLRWFYNQASRNFVPSDATIKELKSRGFKRLSLWQRGIDTDNFSPLYADPRLRQRWSPDGSPIALFAGRLVKEKDVEILIKADSILKQRGVEYKLVFVGDGPMKSELARALPDAIFAGFLRGQELSRAYASADIFAFPSTTESFGNVVLEAAASGLPCVVPTEGGVMDLVHDGVTGYLAKPQDPEDFASRMESLLTNEWLRNSFSVRAIDYASKRKWHEVNKTLFNGYEELLRKSNRLERYRRPVRIN